MTYQLNDYSRKRQKISRPSDIILRTTDQGVEIVKDWYSQKRLLELGLSILFDIFILICFLVQVVGNQAKAFELACIFLPVLFASLNLTYHALAGVYNRTVFQMTDGLLIVKHEPFPWPGKVAIPLREVQQLYCKQIVYWNQRLDRTPGENMRIIGHLRKYYPVREITYRLVAILENGREKSLLTGLEQPETAIFLEIQMERLMKLADEPVESEYLL